MPLAVVFGRPHGAPYQTAFYDRLSFRGSAIFADDGPEAIARHERHHWTPAGAEDKDIFYTRLDIAGPLKVHLQRKAAEVNYGPYSAFSMVNGVAYAEGTVFGFEDVQRGDWYSVQDRQHWDLMILNSETAPRNQP